MHIETKALPAALRDALESVGYRRESIQLETRDTLPRGIAGKGSRPFTMAVDLATGERSTQMGSWGGANPFVDVPADSHAPVPLPPGVVGISGSTGYRCSATLYAPAATLAPLLPAAPEVTPEERKVLAIVGGIKGGARRPYFEVAGLGEYSASNPLIAGLASRGLLKVNRAGAIKITTAGRNARGDERVW